MTTFDPNPGQSISFIIHDQSISFSAVPSPASPDFAYQSEGAKAIVYQLVAPDGCRYALKKMKNAYRDASISTICSHLNSLRSLPGLRVCDRLCLDHAASFDVINQWADLEFAVLMPWIGGLTWYDIRATQGKKWPQGLQDTPEGEVARLQVAADFIGRLAKLEDLHIAHCDLSPGNLLFEPDTHVTELVDVEDLYGPVPFQKPPNPSRGTEGYQHRNQIDISLDPWRPEADRLAAAILVAEILTLHDGRVQSSARLGDDSYFEAADTTSSDLNNPRFAVLRDALMSCPYGADLVDLFVRAWSARALSDCPALSEWNDLLRQWQSAKTTADLSLPTTALDSERFSRRPSDLQRHIFQNSTSPAAIYSFDPQIDVRPIVSSFEPVIHGGDNQSPPAINQFHPITPTQMPINWDLIPEPTGPPISNSVLSQPLSPKPILLGNLQPIELSGPVITDFQPFRSTNDSQNSADASS